MAADSAVSGRGHASPGHDTAPEAVLTETKDPVCKYKD
jgi:hypothetical protein